MNMLLILLTLIAIFLFDRTLGKAFDSQRSNKDIFRKDWRGMQRAKEMLSSDQANFSTNPQKSETNNRSAFERFSVPISNDGPASTINSFLSQLTVVPTSSFSHFHVPTNATNTTTGLTSEWCTNRACLRNDCNNNSNSDSSSRNCNYEHAKISAQEMQSNSSSTQDDEPKHSASRKFDG
jgi:hypothetical protein